LNPLDQVVTVSEMAEALGVSVQYIRKQCKDGKLNCRKSSDGVWLILKSSIIKENEK
jgi:predicted site-specific integrase-resolvase